MNKTNIRFSSGATDFYFSTGFGTLKKIVDPNAAVIITDENVYQAHGKKLAGYKHILLQSGEVYKTQETVDSVVRRLIEMQADRKTVLVGVGGGVVTDITGYVAAVYMRGLPFGFAPTSLLALVDASIGGKNGVDVGLYKNLVGTIRQPSFILQDMIFLNSLPQAEWENGFAEIIKHACIKDEAMFRELEKNSFAYYQNKQKNICDLVQRNTLIKTRVVQKDEFEKADRRLLNFGHTLGHAVENQYALSHGQAISIGMAFASNLSEKLTGFKHRERLLSVLQKFNLPIQLSFDKQKVFDLLKMDKKRERKEMNFVLLNKIGKGIVQPIKLTQLEKMINSY